MIKFSVRHPVSITMLIGILIVIGLVSLSRLGLDLLPELTYPAVTIITNYSGVAPEDIENMITKPIEEVVSTISGVKKVSSYSMEGVSYVTVEFEWGKNLDFAAQDIRDKIGMIEDYLPEDASRPLVLKFDLSMMPILENYAYSKFREPEEVKKIIENEIKPDLERIEGIASVEVMGGREKEILVEVELSKLKRYGLSLGGIVNILKFHNINLPAGYLERGSKEYLLRGVGEFEGIEDIEKVVVGVTKGRIPIFLKDVAKVYDSYSDRRGYFRMGGRETIYFVVYKQSGVNTVKVVERAKRELSRIRKRLPKDIVIGTTFDQAKFIKRATTRTINNALVGALLAAVMIFIFLGALRPTLIISIAIPLSIIMTFIVLYLAKYTLNIMTLGGIALGVGMLVDNAVVVLENIFRQLEIGKNKEKAAIDGAQEVGTAISASTFTNIVIFLPLIFVGGMIARLTYQLAVTVSVTMIASLFVAITIIPMLARVVLREEKFENKKSSFLRGWFEPLRNSYRKALDFVLHHRALTLSLTAGFLLISLLLLKIVGIEFFPRMDRDFGIIEVTLPPGTSLEETDYYFRQIESIAKKLPGVKEVGSTIGKTETASFFFGGEDVNRGMLYLLFKPRKERKKRSYEIIGELLEKIPQYKGAKVRVLDISKMLFLGYEARPIKINIYGKDLKELKRIATEVKERIEKIEGVDRPEISLEEAKPELVLKIDREKAAQFGLTPYEIENELQIAMMGKIATQLRRKGEEIDIRVRLSEEERNHIEDIEALTIRNSGGIEVPLREVAQFSYTLGPIKIEREKQTRVVSVGAENKGRSVGKIMADVSRVLSSLKLPSGYVIEFAGEFEKIKEMIKDMGFALLAAILLIYMTMAALFESFRDPLIVMFTVPLSIIGVIFLFLITGTTISVTSLMGVLILMGVVVNNAIVMIDYIKRLIRGGMGRYEAVLEGASIRLRPILVTAFTTIFGMIPMALSRSEGAELRSPMAIAVIGGLAGATFLTLFVIPTVFSIFERVRPPS